MQFLEDNYLPDLQENIVVEHMVDPRYFQNTLNSHLGAAFSVEPILTQSAWFRPHNRSEDFENLYFLNSRFISYGWSGLRVAIMIGMIEAEKQFQAFQAFSAKLSMEE